MIYIKPNEKNKQEITHISWRSPHTNKMSKRRVSVKDDGQGLRVKLEHETYQFPSPKYYPLVAAARVVVAAAAVDDRNAVDHPM
jgi:hypothetical protein